MRKQSIINKIRSLTKKYNWDFDEELELESVIDKYGKFKFDEGCKVLDVNLLNRLGELIKSKTIEFHFDIDDGYFAEVSNGPNLYKMVADLDISAKRETLQECILATIEYLEKRNENKI